MEGAGASFRDRALQTLNDEYSRVFLTLLSKGFAILRSAAMSAFDDPRGALERSRAIRAFSVENMPELLEEFERNATLRGARVLWAEDGDDACRMVASIARERGIDLIAKGKSMVTEEIGLNEHLAGCGITSQETDLGEFITQLLGRGPFHIVGPAINIPPDRIADAFVKAGIITEHSTDAVVLGKAVRAHLRETFKGLGMGVVGVNMAVASTGTIVNVENEGNIRMIKASPRTLVAVMTPEKVVPGIMDAAHLLKILSRNCTGQKMAGSVTLDTGPTLPEEKDGPDELIVIIADCKRSSIYCDPLTRQVLRCIRCGACLNTCPVYASIGGYAYGRVYSGPLGSVLAPLIWGDRENADLFRACTLCGACAEICPAGVDHPSLILASRARETASSPLWPGILKTLCAEAAGVVMASPRAWSNMVHLGRLGLRRLSESGHLHRLPGPMKGWLAQRDLPAIAAPTFTEWWRHRKRSQRQEKMP